MSNQSPKVSVLMPAYNAESYIAAAIESILDQSYRDLELIIADDQSTDRTWDIVQEYCTKDNRIRLYRNEKNSGVSKTRNQLLAMARGEYIAWQDADDISFPDRIRKQVDHLDNNPDVAIVGAYLQLIDPDGQQLNLRTYESGDENLRRNAFKYSPVSQPVAMIKHAVLEQSGHFDENLRQAEDLDLSFRIGRYGAFANLPEPLLYYRYHPNSLSSNKLKENIACTLIVRKRAAFTYGYRMRPVDYAAFAATWCAQFLPAEMTQRLFVLLRDIFK